jgi:quinol monooxygenase YgiN
MLMSAIAIRNDVATFINVFTIEPGKQRALLDRLKMHARTSVGRQPGFLRANAHRSLDGASVVNYVQWTSVEASKAIHRDPDISAAFASYRELDVRMDLRYYEVAFTQKGRVSMQTQDCPITQIELLHVAPENQQLLLEKLIRSFEPVFTVATGHISTVWLRSLDRLRIINYSQWSSREQYETVKAKLDPILSSENAIEHADSHLYAIDFIVDTRDLSN